MKILKFFGIHPEHSICWSSYYKDFYLRDAFGIYRPAFGLNGYIVTVDECEFVEKNETIDGVDELVKYLQEDRLFLLRDYDLITEQVEVNIIISRGGSAEGTSQMDARRFQKPFDPY